MSNPISKKKKIPEIFFSAMIIHDGWKIIYILLTVKHVTKPLLYPACKNIYLATYTLVYLLI